MTPSYSMLLETIFTKIASDFTPSVYLLTTKILGIAWSAADILLVYYFLKIAELAKQKLHQKKIRFRFMALWASLILTPFLLITTSSQSFFILDSLICGIQYVILLVTLIQERNDLLTYFRHIVYPKLKTSRKLSVDN